MSSKKSILTRIRNVDRYLGVPVNLMVFSISKLSPRNLLKKNKQNSIEKILIIRLGAIGDSILSIPMIRELRKKYPKAKIHMLTTSKTGKIYEEFSYFNKITTFKFVEEKGLFHSSSKNLSQLRGIIKELRKENFDLVIDTEQYSRVTPIISHLIKPNKKVGFNSKGEHRSILFDHKVPHCDEKPESECFLDLLNPLNIPINEKCLEFPTKRSPNIDALFKKNKITKKDFVVAMHPGNSQEFAIKRWPKERFAKVAKSLVGKYNAKIILVGAPHELELANEVKKLSKENLIISVGKTKSLNELAYLLSKCDLFVGNDSTPMHLSAAVGIKSVAIFGPANSKKWGPYGNSSVVVQKNLPCSPCWKRGTMNQKCQYPLPCEKAINVKDVLNAVDKLIMRNKK